MTADIHMRPATKDVDLVFWSDLHTLYAKHQCSGLIIIGDLLDQKRPPLDYMIWLDDLLLAWEYPLIILRGNHEAPDHTDPRINPLFFYENRARVYWGAASCALSSDEAQFYYLPWMPSKQMKIEAQELAAIAQTKANVNRKKILFAHVGLKEGEVGEDCRVHTEISIKDLIPEVYDFVLLGDYHRHQFLTDNALYLGAPFPKTYNDTFSVGVWLLDLNGSEVSIESLPLPSIYPQYRSWSIKNRQDLVLVGYDSRDVNKIECEVALMQEVANLYPDARVIGEAYNPVLNRGRLEGIENQEAEKVFLSYLKSRMIDNEEIKELGVKYIQAAKKV